MAVRCILHIISTTTINYRRW